ncbi:MAG TPA: hypothetical protein VLK35_10565 [Methylomirabilota bacterium]|nr:hypothetical protein [Methylomirabilota bacterium]
MSTVLTLQQVIEKQALGPDARAFCEALLRQGEVLAVTLSYLPETVLWLVTTPLQARLMRNAHPLALIITLAEAVDLARAVGDPRPTSLWQVAATLSAPAPGNLDDPKEPEDLANPWD